MMPHAHTKAGLPEAPPPASWPMRFLLASDRPQATHTVLHRMPAQRHPQSGTGDADVPGAISRYGLSGMLLHRIRQQGLNPPAGYVQQLQKQALTDVGVVANRKASLQKLNTLAGRHGVHPILFKGAATGLCCYPRESLRLALDIDCVIPEGTIDLFCQKYFVNTQESHFFASVGAMRVEFHLYTNTTIPWGSYEDLKTGCKPAPGYSNLLIPSPETLVTCALIHFAYHLGQTSWDMLDISFLLQKNLVWERLTALWQDRGLVPTILPGLITAAAIMTSVPEERVITLWQALTARQKKAVVFCVNHAYREVDSSVSFLYNRSRLLGQSFMRTVCRRFFGSLKETEFLTGLQKPAFNFWVNHLLVLPCRRLARELPRLLKSLH